MQTLHAPPVRMRRDKGRRRARAEERAPAPGRTSAGCIEGTICIVECGSAGSLATERRAFLCARCEDGGKSKPKSKGGCTPGHCVLTWRDRADPAQGAARDG
jgi:hypothetical protein